jgi:hypothetical protein
MAVLIEAISVVIRVDSIQRQFSGGWPEFKKSVPNRTLCDDNEIARVGFMTPADVQAFVRVLESRGLTHLRDRTAADCVVVEQMHGPCNACEWIEFGSVMIEEHQVDAGRLKGSTVRQLATPEGWTFENSLSCSFGFVPKGELDKSLRLLRREDDLEIYWNALTGKEVYVRRARFGSTGDGATPQRPEGRTKPHPGRVQHLISAGQRFPGRKGPPSTDS